MKPLLIVIIAALCSCQVTEVTRELPGGGLEKVTSKGLTAPAREFAWSAAALAGDLARVRAGVPVETKSGK